MEESAPLSPSQPDLDSPWCGNCELHSGYKVVLGNVTRLDSDSGTYPETLEVRRCLECNEDMFEIKDYKRVIMVVNVVLSFIWLSLFYCSFYLFDEPKSFCLALLFLTVSVSLIWFFPTKARTRFGHWKKWAATQIFLELPN